jgi:hypothetical protein
MAILTQEQVCILEAALNERLPGGYDDFDEFADVVLSTIDIPGDGQEWTISPYHTGERWDMNDWNSRMRIGEEIELPHIDAVAIWNTWKWTVESRGE